MPGAQTFSVSQRSVAFKIVIFKMHVLVVRSDYVQDEVNYDVERFDARFELSAMDLDPITWTNYKQYFPSTESVICRRHVCERKILHPADTFSSRTPLL